MNRGWKFLKKIVRRLQPFLGRLTVSLSYLDHGGHGVDTAQVLHDALGEVGHAQTDGPVGVALQLDHLIGTGAIQKGLVIST